MTGPMADQPPPGGETPTDPDRAVGSTVLEHTGPRADPIKASDISSLPELIEFAYGLKGKQVRVTRKVLEKVSAWLKDADADSISSLATRLEELSASDPLLTVPPRLFVGLENAGAPHQLKLRVAQLFRHHLHNHPLFVPRPVSQSTAGAPGEVNEESDTGDVWLRRARIRAADISSGDIGRPETELKPLERDRLKTNAITTAALVFSVLEDWDNGRLVRGLSENLWIDSAAPLSANRIRVAIIETATAEALGGVCRVFEDVISDVARSAEQARAEAARAEERANNLLQRVALLDEEASRLRGTIAQQKEEIAALQGDISALQNRIETEKRDRIIDQSHHIDEYEILRTRIMRSLRKNIDLLADGLHAVRNQSYSVTEEFVERALESMSKELRQLDGEGGGQWS